MKSPISTTTSLVLALGLVACGEDVPPLENGSMALTWQVSPRGCDAAGVRDVSVTLDGPERLVDSFDCDSEGAEIRNLTPGTYRVSLDGFDVDGQVIFESEAESVVVHADGIARTPHLRLTAKPATLAIGWRFENGKVCGANGISTIDVRVFDKADYEIGGAQFDCNSGAGEIGGFTAGTYVVEAVAVSDDGPIYQGLANTAVDRGQVVDVEVVLGADD